MKVAIPREIIDGECRVAATPSTVARLIKLGFEVCLESGAGTLANFTDAAYESAGAQIVTDTKTLWGNADVVLKVEAPTHHPDCNEHETQWLQPGATVISFVQADLNPAVIEGVKARSGTLIAMEKVPRITRAQKMDALSSMANIAGYRAVIEAANVFGSFFTGQITAAGKVPPARVLVIGAGVAGLAAIGAARGLGAEVRAFDTRGAVREQVQSMGARFLEVQIEEEGESAGGYAKVMSQAFIDAEMALFREQAKEVDIVITTALIPGRDAPKLWLKDMVESMKAGSVVVDLAAPRGGNCELTEAGQAKVHAGVHILGYTDLVSRMARTSSELYSSNLVHLLDDLSDAGQLHLDPMDDIVRSAVLVHEGQTPTWPDKPESVAPKPAPTPQQSASPTEVASPQAAPETTARKGTLIALGSSILLFVIWGLLEISGHQLASDAGVSFLQHLTVFALACVIGWHVIWNVTPALHTPLMSVTNAISGIIVLGGLLHLNGQGPLGLGGWLSLIAVLLATINVAGGFLVTERMLRMFRK